MAEDGDIGQALSGVRDANSAFGFIEWFAREWQTPLRDGDGCTAEQAVDDNAQIARLEAACERRPFA